MNIIIVDYGLGNIGSILNMLNRVGIQARYSASADDIEIADKIILPGVGSFDYGMKQLKKSGLLPILEKKVLIEKTPILGICLGMQMLLDSSEEGCEKGLSWIKGKSIKLLSEVHGKKLKIPHMGWNIASCTCPKSLFYGITDHPQFYFVHSYHAVCENEQDVLSWTEYGASFASAVQRDNIYGVQFHPEKSHRFGMQLLKNFVEHA